MARTTSTLVEEMLRDRHVGGNYDGSTVLTQFITSAYYSTNDMVECLARKGKTYDDERLTLIETWLACYYYTKSDPQKSSASVGGASGSFQTDPTVPEWFKKGAIDLDPSGCLNAILNPGKVASVSWLGKRKSAQTDHVDRN